MQDDSSTFGLNREELSKLWQLGEDLPPGQEDLDTAEQKAELLQQHLAESLPLDAGMAQMLPELLNVVCDKLKPFTGCSFQSLLLDPKSDLSVIETIKELHKKQSESAPSDMQRKIAIIIYYAAIASALVHHKTKITKYSYSDLVQSFAEMIQDEPLPADLKELITRAYELCGAHIEK